jgi:predicted nuclease of predicted toxin-antitoxin system
LKILLDHNLDRRLKLHLTDHDVATTQELDWSDVLNGELLTLAESHSFDVLVTADSNIKNQQNLSNRRIAILVIRSFNNRLATHVEMIDQINRALSEMRPSQIVEIFHRDMRQR